MLALVLGTLLAVGALAFVLFPLFMETVARPVIVRGVSMAETQKLAEQEAVVALREIEFDRATGKLSDADYDDLRTRYTARALEAMRGSSASPDDAIEAAVAAYRARIKSCIACGPRPEPDATYCSNCGRYLAGGCATCGAPITEAGATFCSRCGHGLAA